MALDGVYVSRLPAELLSFPAGQHDDEVDQDLQDSGWCRTGLCVLVIARVICV